MNFKSYYKGILKDLPENEYFWKSNTVALTVKELMEARSLIFELQQKGLPSSKIISKLQDWNAKLVERYRAERVFWTETKRRESAQVADAGEELKIDNYRVILSPNACDVCKKISQNGKRIYDSNDIADAKEIPPYHPNCYCVLIPK